MSEKSVNTKTSETSSASVDVEKQETSAKSSHCSNGVAVDNNNHFFEEKVKERAPPGINGSLVFLYALFFTVFAIGVININRCPLSRLIPIYLVVAGFTGALAKYISKFDNKYCFWGTIILVSADVIWHGVGKQGSYVVYKEYQPSYNPKDPFYCNRTTYLVAFWTLTLEYTLLLFFILLSCCYMLMRKDFRTESGSN